MLGSSGVVGYERTEEDRGSKENLCLLEILGESNVEDGVLAVLCKFISIVSYFVAKEGSFSDTKPCLGEFAVDIAFNAAIEYAFEVGTEFFISVGTDEHIIEDSDGEI